MSEHEMHLPHGSIWPFWVAMGITAVGLGLIFIDFEDLASATSLILPLGLAFLVTMLLGWVREDFHWWNTNTGTGLHIPKAGTLLFIGSEIFLFGALFATYFTFRSHTLTSGGHWPDPNGHGEFVHLPLLTTFVFSLFLFASSWTLHKAEVYLKKGDRAAFKKWWLYTIILGLIFLGGQVNEYLTLIHEGQTLGSSHFMTAFYMLTGTHGLHVFGGLCVLIIVYVRAVKGQFDEHRHAAPQAASLYWHFVDIVWVVVFTVLYLLTHDWSKGIL